MRAKLIHCLLLAIVLSMVGCGAIGSFPYFSSESARMEKMAMYDEASAQRLDSAFNEGLALVADLRYSQATAKLLPLIEAFEAAGDQNRAGEATFWVGYCYEKQGQEDEAIESYNRVVRTYPQTSASRQAAERLSRMAIRTGP